MQKRTRNYVIGGSAIAVGIAGGMGLLGANSYPGDSPQVETGTVFLDTHKGGEQLDVVVMGRESAARKTYLADGAVLEPWCYAQTPAGSIAVRSMIVRGGGPQGSLVDILPAVLYPSMDANEHVDADALGLETCDQLSPMDSTSDAPAPALNPTRGLAGNK